ncbi:hypothetical protein PG991_012536 [Apiospora marii]|uniref:C2H2-type domain-containing protein n=1 Tax=Apiospora marii TaxID=335849 RepID=A0ABR1R9Z7_9PEZI
MSDGTYNFDFDVLLDLNAHPVTQVTRPDNAADDPLVSAGSIPDWLYTGIQWPDAGPSQVTSTHAGGFETFGTGVNLIEAPFSLNPFPATYQALSGVNQFAVPGSTQNEVFNFDDFDGTIASANLLTFPCNANSFATGIDLGVPYELSLPAIGAGTSFGFGTTIGTTPAPFIAKEQTTPDESALLQPDAGFDATADRLPDASWGSSLSTMIGQASSPQLEGQKAAEDAMPAASPPPKEKYWCSKCNYTTNFIVLLEEHAKEKRHAILKCKTPGCATSFTVQSHLEAHEAHAHVPGHSQVEPHGLHTCAECGEPFKNRTQQQAHGDNSQHSPFVCACGATFSRVDVLHRHIDGYAKEGPRFPCKFCKFHRGKHGFRRRDHLVQHLRGYHKFDDEEVGKVCPKTKNLKALSIATCPHRGCEFFRDESFQKLAWVEQILQKPFPNQATFTKHLKEVHSQTPFPCDFEGCDKVGAKGYVREKDLMKHLVAKHPEAPGYNPKPRQTMYPCGVEDCDKTYTSTTGRFQHQRDNHWTLEQRSVYWNNLLNSRLQQLG